MVVYALRTLAAVPEVRSIVLVVAADQSERAADVLHKHGPLPVPIHLAHGGAERQDSVAAGLMRADPSADLVIVHDAARPFVSLGCVMACIEAAARGGAAIAALPARDTVKLVSTEGIVTDTLDRRTIWLAQTPQVFRASLLRQAYERARRDVYVGTDDAALVERIGGVIRVVPGEWANQKITTQADLDWAEWYLRNR
jgi:2-C-methyl-D-erythritol 4-phosphate cytidylyltransferase